MVVPSSRLLLLCNTFFSSNLFLTNKAVAIPKNANNLSFISVSFPTSVAAAAYSNSLRMESEIPEDGGSSKPEAGELKWVVAQQRSNGSSSSSQEEPLVQYIVVRKDLIKDLKWPLGSVISQACHAAVAAIWLHKDDQHTMQYCKPDNLEHMRKVTLEVDGETQLLNFAQKLDNASIVHKLWIEQPENIPTCLATKPYRKAEVALFFKKIKLFK
ncbi:hypothetical protein O6H91_03G012600 [Diphasiastrum complanatum]|uniref:Uncharacterized protein n=1 Tax=Diphasiastrum complanatum TaxID=34168 RepID=A0ACC2E3H5_DIPCM|nr:hypothetical protein O6H91_03G012600 [Diphasiastrum complanatum]